MKKEIAIIILVLVVILGGAVLLNKKNTGQPGKYDAFATCLKDQGAIFYGAFWCPHCKAQKDLFGDSVKYLPYVECSTPDSQSQTPICAQKGIQSYPTWIFTNGDKLSGEVPLADLAAKTGCSLPAGEGTTATTTPGGATIINGMPATSTKGSNGQ